MAKGGAVICPVCGDEYVDGVTVCPECGGQLIEPSAAEQRPLPESAHHEPVCVFTDGRAARIALAKSILSDAGIDFGVVGEEVQDLFGWGRFPAGSNLFMGPVRLLVAEEDADVAVELLAVLNDDAPTVEPPGVAGVAERIPNPNLTQTEGQGAPTTWGRMRRFATGVVGLILIGFLAEILFSLAELGANR